MARYIDAEKLALEPDEQGGANGVLIIERQNGKTMRMVLAALKQMIDAAPAEDVAQVVHGRWVAVPSSDMMTGKAYKCSECNKMRYGSFMPNYCQNCGAKMDGRKEDA